MSSTRRGFQIECRGMAAVLWRQGTRHHQYEDRYRLLNESIPLVRQAGRGSLHAVADGVGSAPLGMSAAQHVCDALQPSLTGAKAQPADQALVGTLQQASREIHAWGPMDDGNRPRGACAATVLWLSPDQQRGVIVHAGDTRALLIRDGAGQLLTPLDQAADGALRRYFGQADLALQAQPLAVEPGDRLLLVSDGITKSLHAAEMVQILEGEGDPARALAALGEACLRRDSGDDATAVLVEVG